MLDQSRDALFALLVLRNTTGKVFRRLVATSTTAIFCEHVVHKLAIGFTSDHMLFVDLNIVV